jgi:hypothetical protein
LVFPLVGVDAWRNNYLSLEQEKIQDLSGAFALPKNLYVVIAVHSDLNLQDNNPNLFLDGK